MGGPATAQAGRGIPVPCSGNWQATSEYVDGQSVGGAMRIRGGRNEGVASVEVFECGRRIRVTQGQPLDLVRTSLDPVTYEGELSMGGVHRTFRFVMDDPQTMIGEVVAQDPRLRVNRPTRITFLGGVQPEDIGCAEDTDRDVVDAELRDEVIEIIAETLGIPRQEAPRYMSSLTTAVRDRMSDADDGTPSRRVEANLLLDEAGRLLPVTTDGSRAGGIRVDQPGTAVCSVTEDTLPAAYRRLQFILISPEMAGLNQVHAKLVEPGTARVVRSSLQDVHAAGRSARETGIETAYEGIGEPVTGRH